MTTIINGSNPSQMPEKENTGSGFLIGTVVFVVFLAVVLYFGVPALNNAQPIQVNVPAPQVTVETPQVVVPDKVEVVTAE